MTLLPHDCSKGRHVSQAAEEHRDQPARQHGALKACAQGCALPWHSL